MTRIKSALLCTRSPNCPPAYDAVYAELAAGHIFGHKHPLPGTADAVKEAVALSAPQLNHEGVKVRCRPEPKQSEARTLMFACKRLSVGQQRWPFVWPGKEGREYLWKVIISIFVTDEKLQFVWAMRFRRCHGYSRDNLRIVLAVGWGDNSCAVHLQFRKQLPLL